MYVHMYICTDTYRIYVHNIIWIFIVGVSGRERVVWEAGMVGHISQVCGQEIRYNYLPIRPRISIRIVLYLVYDV